MSSTSTESRMAEREHTCGRLRRRLDDRIEMTDAAMRGMLAHCGRLQGQMAVMGDVASTLMPAVDDPVRLRLTSGLQVAAGNFPPGPPPHFEEGFRESSNALIPDIRETS